MTKLDFFSGTDVPSFQDDDLLGHCVVLGATGSGKTGLLVGLIEESLLAGVSVVVIDSKSDLGNLVLTNDTLDAEAFEPWTAHHEADAGEIAARWVGGLKMEGLLDRYRAYHQIERRIYTPGSSAGRPLCVFSTLDPPVGDPASHADAVAIQVLALAGIDDDSTSPSVVFVANLLLRFWEENRAPDLGQLIGAILCPPFSRLGVVSLDQMIPPKAREKLAIALNTLVASPAFQTLSAGDQFDTRELLGDSDNARCAIVSVGHLDQSLREVVVARLADILRTASLENSRMLVVIDEAGSYAPAHGCPATEDSILRLMKAGRARGIGVVLASHNTTDLDHRVMGGAETWFVGRLGMERDLDRIVESTGLPRADLREAVQALATREFLLHRLGHKPAQVRSRHALSFLGGPMTLTQIRDRESAVPDLEPEIAAVPGDSDEGSWAERWAAGNWVEVIGSPSSDGSWAPAVVVSARVTWDRPGHPVDLVDSTDWVVFPADAGVARPINRVGSISATSPTGWSEPPPFHHCAAASELVASEVARRDRMLIAECPELHLSAHPGEPIEVFEQRCAKAAVAAAAAEVSEVHDQLERKRNAVVERVAGLPDDPDVASAKAGALASLEALEEELLGAGGLADAVQEEWLARSRRIRNITLTHDAVRRPEFYAWILWVQCEP